MSANVLNGNAINEVSFPGAESGLASIQLAATIKVSGTVSSYYLKHAIEVSTEAKAVASASLMFLRSVGFSQSCAAVTSASCLNHAHVKVTGTASAVTSMAISLRRGIAVETQARADTSAYIHKYARLNFVSQPAQCVGSIAPVVYNFVTVACEAKASGSMGCIVYRYLTLDPVEAKAVPATIRPYLRLYADPRVSAVADCSVTAFDYSATMPAVEVLLVPADDNVLRVTE